MKKIIKNIWFKIIQWTPFVLKKVCVWYLKKLGFKVYEPGK